ncbi:MAG: TetR/AcrR family transcriptional regulator [Oscillospiraceae bacterium]
MKKSTKEKILEESLELFSQNGYSGTSMSDIADKVGITKAALYKHFSGKEQIFDELLTIGEEHYESNFGSKTKLSSIPKSGEELVSLSMKQIDFTLHDEDIVKFRKLFTIEQFRDEKIAKLATKHFIEIPENMYSLIFEKMMENGALKQDDPKLLAAEYIAPVTPMINMCDRQPEREEEIIQRISQHFERFISLYAVKQE